MTASFFRFQVLERYIYSTYASHEVVPKADVYRCMVIEHGESQELVATATLLVEAMNLLGSRVGTSC